MRDCDQCGAACALDGEVWTLAGERGEMLDAPSLFAIGETTEVLGRRWLTEGHVRFSYGPGWWDEFWCREETAAFGGEDGYAWFSVDEGDVAMELTLGLDDPAPPRPTSDEPAASFRWPSGRSQKWPRQSYSLAEDGSGECLAFRGALPEVIRIGESHRFRTYVSDAGGLMTHERWAGEESWSAGRWIDPWDVAGPAQRRGDAS